MGTSESQVLQIVTNPAFCDITNGGPTYNGESCFFGNFRQHFLLTLVNDMHAYFVKRIDVQSNVSGRLAFLLNIRIY